MDECQFCGKRGFMLKLNKCGICNRKGCSSCVASTKALARIGKRVGFIVETDPKFICAACSDRRAREKMDS